MDKLIGFVVLMIIVISIVELGQEEARKPDCTWRGEVNNGVDCIVKNPQETEKRLCFSIKIDCRGCDGIGYVRAKANSVCALVAPSASSSVFIPYSSFAEDVVVPSQSGRYCCTGQEISPAEAEEEEEEEEEGEEE